MTPRRYELSDFEWSIIEPLLPNKPRGVPRSDDRKVLNGIYWRLRTGSPWADIPERYGPCDDLLQPFRPLGQDRRLGSDIRGDLKSLRRRSADDRQFLDPRPPAWRQRQKGGSEETSSAARDLAGARCMGRSRGGLTTKIHALVDANGLPILLKLTAGQAHDGRSAADMLAGLGEGQILLADRGYDSDALRARLARQGAWGNIKPMPDRVNVPSFSRLPLSLSKSRRTLLQQAQTFPSRRDALRKARRQLPRPRQTRRHPNMVPVYESVT